MKLFRQHIPKIFIWEYPSQEIENQVQGRDPNTLLHHFGNSIPNIPTLDSPPLFPFLYKWSSPIHLHFLVSMVSNLPQANGWGYFFSGFKFQVIIAESQSRTNCSNCCEFCIQLSLSVNCFKACNKRIMPVMLDKDHDIDHNERWFPRTKSLPDYNSYLVESSSCNLKDST